MVSAIAALAMPTSTAAWMIWKIGAVGGRPVDSPCSQDQMGLRDRHVVDAVTVPLAVVRWPKLDQSSITVRPLRVALGDRVPGSRPSSSATIGTQMGEQCAGGVELAAVDQDTVAASREAWSRTSARDLVPNSEKALPKRMPRRTSAEEKLLLRLVGDGADRRDHVEVVLRDLADARVGLRDDRDHLGQGDVGDERRRRSSPGTLIAPEAALREALDLRRGRVRLRSRSAAPSRELGGEPLATSIASASSRMTWARAGRWSAERGARGPALAGISAREMRSWLVSCGRLGDYGRPRRAARTTASPQAALLRRPASSARTRGRISLPKYSTSSW